MSITHKAVLYIQRSTDSKNVNNLATKVHEHMGANGVIYKTPDPTLDEIKTENDLLTTLIADADDGDHTMIAKRDKQSTKVYDLLKAQVDYVNKVAKGAKETILVSGFDVNNDNEDAELPGHITIKGIAAGKEEGTVKVNIEVDENATMYHLEMTETPNDESSYKTVIITTNSRALLARNITKKKEFFFRVSAGNSVGWGIHSNVTSFILQ